MINLFQWGEFTSRNGVKLPFKIDCDALTNADLTCIANDIANRISFSDVYGIPRGGVALADKLLKFCVPELNTLLIVDDVMTTGGSLIDAYDKFKVKYKSIYFAVIFDRCITELPRPLPSPVYSWLELGSLHD